MAELSYPDSVKTVSVKLPEPLADWLARRSHKLGRTQSQTIREALERQRKGEDRPKNCAALLRGLDGFFDGPRDLSTNPKYLQGFGE